MGRVIIVGNSGYIGSSLIRKFKSEHCDVLTAGRRNADLLLSLEDPSTFAYQSLQAGDTILFTAAVSSPDRCAEDFDYCWKTNVEGTAEIISRMLERGARVLFFSSDAVYSSDPSGIYDESTELAPDFPYGKMKAEIEQRFSDNHSFKAVRLSYVFSGDDKYTSYLRKCMTSGNEAEVFHPYYRSCISLSDVSAATYWLFKNWSSFSHKRLNLAGMELVSRVRMADELSLMDESFSYSILEPDPGFYLTRSKITQMKSLYLYAYDIIEARTFSEAFRAELKG